MTDTTLTAAQSGSSDDGDYLLAFVAAAGPRGWDFIIQIDSELEYVEWRGDQFARPWQVRRGYLGTNPGAHDNGAAVIVEPSLGSGAGTMIVTDGTKIVNPATTLLVSAGLLVDLGGGVAQVNGYASQGTGDDNGEAVFLGGGSADPAGTGTGGNAQVFAGDGGATGPGGNASLAGGYGSASSGGLPAQLTASGGSQEGTGGDLLGIGGDAAGGSNRRGGDFIVTPGAGDGSERPGLVFLNLPTSDPHVAGALWANSQIVTVSAG